MGLLAGKVAKGAKALYLQIWFQSETTNLLLPWNFDESFFFVKIQPCPVSYTAYALVIWMLRTCACSSKMDGYCSLNFLTALITKWCFTSPASQMVVVIVFFETLLMTSWANLCANRSLWVGLAVPFDHCLSNRWFPSWGSEFQMIFASWKVVITMNFLTWKMILIMWIIQINCVFDNSATQSDYTASSLYFRRVTNKREKFTRTKT